MADLPATTIAQCVLYKDWSRLCLDVTLLHIIPSLSNSHQLLSWSKNFSHSKKPSPCSSRMRPSCRIYLIFVLMSTLMSSKVFFPSVTNTTTLYEDPFSATRAALCICPTNSTRWFKYDWDYLCVNKSQFVPVIFEPPCIILDVVTLTILDDEYELWGFHRDIVSSSLLLPPFQIQIFS